MFLKGFGNSRQAKNLKKTTKPLLSFKDWGTCFDRFSCHLQLIDVQSVESRREMLLNCGHKMHQKVIARQYLYGILSFSFLCSNPIGQRETFLFLEKLYRLSNSKIFTMWAALTVKAQNFLELRNIVFRSAGFQRHLSTLVNFHNISTNWWRKEITSAVLRSQGLLPFRVRYYFCLGSFQYVANSLFELIVILIKKSSLCPWKCLERQYLFFPFMLLHFIVIFALFWMWQNSPTLEQWNNCLILKLTLECFTLLTALSKWMWHSNSIQNKPTSEGQKTFHIPIRKKCNDLTLFVLRDYILLS